MDWAVAIDKNREALRRILAMLFAMAGLRDADKTQFLPRRLHRAVLRLLRPAEAAVRRLIIVAARDIAIALPHAGATTAGEIARGRSSGFGPRDLGTAGKTLSLPLFDALPRFRRLPPVVKISGVPRISLPGYTTPVAIPHRRPPSPDDSISSARLGLRLAALGRVLDDLPRAARRFARWRATLQAPAQDKKFRRIWPLRPGRPPGLPRRTAHEVHDILSVVHGLAFWALERRDTS